MEQILDFIVVGAGLAGIQASLMLAESSKSFKLIEAEQRVGGRIKSTQLSDILKEQSMPQPSWMSDRQRKAIIEQGATWISADHTEMMKLASKYNLSLYHQNTYGQVTYGVEFGNYVITDNLIDFYQKYEKDLNSVLNSIEKLKSEYESLCGLIKKSKDGENLQNYLIFVKKYDHMNITQYLSEIQISSQIAKQIMKNQVKLEHTLDYDKISLFQIIEDDDYLQILRYNLGKYDFDVEGYRVKQGMMQIPLKMADQVKKICNQKGQKDVFHFEQPVSQIDNSGEVVTVSTSKGTYKCRQVLMCASFSTLKFIKINKISKPKQLLIQNQVQNTDNRVTRLFMVFSQSFWRSKHMGYAVFLSNSNGFPFIEMSCISPTNLSCGILAFIFVGDNYVSWQKKLQEKHGEDAKKQMLKYMKKVVADMYLEGQEDHKVLKQVLMFSRSISDSKYYGAGYETNTKMGIAYQLLKDERRDFQEIFCQDQQKILFLGSEQGYEGKTYMEGAVQSAKRKVGKILQANL